MEDIHKGEQNKPPGSPSPGVQHQTSFEAYIEEQYAITLAMIGARSISSLTESQRATVIRLKNGIRPKPSRIPRRIPQANLQGKRQEKESMNEVNTLLREDTRQLPRRTSDHTSFHNARTRSKVTFNHPGKPVELAQSSNLPSTLYNPTHNGKQKHTGAKPLLAMSKHKWCERVMPPKSKEEDKCDGDVMENSQECETFPNGITYRALVHQQSETEVADTSNDKSLKCEQDELNTSKGGVHVRQNGLTNGDCVQESAQSITTAKQGQFLMDQRKERKMEKDDMYNPLVDSDSKRSQLLASVRPYRNQHDSSVATHVASNKQPYMDHSQYHETDTDAERDTPSINSYSELCKNLENIHLPTHHKRIRWHNVEGYRQQHVNRTQGKSGPIRALQSPHYKPQPKQQSSTGYLQRFLRTNVLKNNTTNCYSTQSTPGHSAYLRHLYPASYSMVPGPVSLPLLYPSAPAFHCTTREPRGRRMGLVVGPHSYSTMDISAPPFAGHPHPGSHPHGRYIRAINHYPHHLPSLPPPPARLLPAAGPEWSTHVPIAAPGGGLAGWPGAEEWTYFRGPHQPYKTWRVRPLEPPPLGSRLNYTFP